MNTIKLFCLPFSGGNKYSYKDYVKHCPSFLALAPLEIPGRGSRSGENLLSNLDQIADDVFNQIKQELNAPYAIYGHSMGGLLAYLLTKKIIGMNLPQPQHLFVTGCAAPSMQGGGLVDPTLPKTEFIQEINKLGGISDGVLKNPDLMDYFEPILRADFTAVATYRRLPGEPFQVPMSVVIGDGEHITYEEAMEWQQETTVPLEVKVLPGNHFFIFDHPGRIIEMIARKLQPQVIHA